MPDTPTHLQVHYQAVINHSLEARDLPRALIGQKLVLVTG